MSDFLTECDRQLLQRHDKISVQSVKGIIGLLISFSKDFQSDILNQSSDVFVRLHSLPSEYFEDVEFLQKLLKYSSNLFEIFVDQSLQEDDSMVSLLYLSSS